MGRSRYMYFGFDEILQETEKAFLIRFDGGDEFWIARSQVASADDYSKGDKDGSISISEWLCSQIGLEE